MLFILNPITTIYMYIYIYTSMIFVVCNYCLRVNDKCHTILHVVNGNGMAPCVGTLIILYKIYLTGFYIPAKFYIFDPKTNKDIDVYYTVLLYYSALCEIFRNPHKYIQYTTKNVTVRHCPNLHLKKSFISLRTFIFVTCNFA